MISRKRIDPLHSREAKEIGVCRVQCGMEFHGKGGKVRIRREVAALAFSAEKTKGQFGVPRARIEWADHGTLEPRLHVRRRGQVIGVYDQIQIRNNHLVKRSSSSYQASSFNRRQSIPGRRFPACG